MQYDCYRGIVLGFTLAGDVNAVYNHLCRTDPSGSKDCRDTFEAGLSAGCREHSAGSIWFAGDQTRPDCVDYLEEQADRVPRNCCEP
jgi:hypothetical protein